MSSHIGKLSDLTPDQQNANLGTEYGASLLENSLRQFGAGRSILVDKDGNVIAGIVKLLLLVTFVLGETLVYIGVQLNQSQMTTEQEVWKAIPGFEGEYEASTFGQIRSVDRVHIFIGRWGKERSVNRKGQLRKTKINNSGYVLVSLRHDETHHVGRLIGLTHVDGYQESLEINHEDGNKLNNHSSNLKWVTKSGNQQHRYDVLKKKPDSQLSGIGKNTPRKLSDEQRIAVREASGSCREIAKQFGVSRASVWRIRTRDA